LLITAIWSPLFSTRVQDEKRLLIKQTITTIG
jgi:hypothetical protein